MITKEHILSIVKTGEFVAGVSTFTSFLLGGAVFSRVIKKDLEAHYALIAEQEIAEAKRYYASLYKVEEYSDPEDLAEAKGYVRPRQAEIDEAARIAQGLRYTTVHPSLEPVLDDGSPEAKELIEAGQKLAKVLDHAAEKQAEDDERDINVVVNVFEQNKPDIPKDRDTSTPYVVTLDEFYENEQEHTQHSVTYYEGDEVLADERDQVIEDISLIGKDNLAFGHLSNDPNVVYVRNDQKKMDFEIARSEGKYAHEVLGFEHSDEPFDRRRRVRRFRGDDE